MKARVFFDAFAECLVDVAIARMNPALRTAMRARSILAVIEAHGPTHAENTGRMFDRLMAEAQNPERR